jgi:apolipoprotein N-acyltransferase
VILEEVRNRFPFGGFGWARVAYSQADAPYAAIASRGGAISLSAITLLIGGFIYFFLNRKVNLLFIFPKQLSQKVFELIISNNFLILLQDFVILSCDSIRKMHLRFHLL